MGRCWSNSTRGRLWPRSSRRSSRLPPLRPRRASPRPRGLQPRVSTCAAAGPDPEMKSARPRLPRSRDRRSCVMCLCVSPLRLCCTIDIRIYGLSVLAEGGACMYLLCVCGRISIHSPTFLTPMTISHLADPHTSLNDGSSAR